MYKYVVQGSDGFTELRVDLQPGQPIKAEGGRMSYMDGTISMETKSGGFFKGLKRSMSGESFFQNVFIGPGTIVFAPNLPGDIIPLDIMAGRGWIIQQDGYIASSPNVEVSSKWGGLKSIFGGEGGMLTHLSTQQGQGIAFIGGYGSIIKHDIAPGQEFIVDTGIFFATEETTQYELVKLGKMKSFLFGGEGLVFKFHGPATVYTQSRAQQALVNYIMGFLPK